MNKYLKCGSAYINKEFVRAGALTSDVTTSNMSEFLKNIDVCGKRVSTIHEPCGRARTHT